MINTTFDAKRACRYVRYARMSTDLQNPRSPDQQFDEIDRTVQRTGSSWVHVRDYRDDGYSGRFAAKRPDYSKMIEDIKTGKIEIDLILVDTLERFGRMTSLDSIRRMLYEHYGVMILTADSSFADPTSTAGQALAVIESMRARQDAGVKAHNVLRGKRDAAHQKHWPGGPAPLGYKLKSVMVPGSEPVEVDYRILEPDPNTAPLVKEIFRLAAEEGLGTARLAQRLNESPQWSKLKSAFYADSLGRILANPIYRGVLVYGRVSTDVIDDRRVIVRNLSGDIYRVENFCEPLIAADVWDTVQSLRAVRGARIKNARTAKKVANQKQIKAPAPGMTLKYPLTGLVRCGLCGASMRPNSGASAKKVARYAYYMCPVRHSGACVNRIYCREPWLRKAVFAALRQRLFPMSSTATLGVPDWFGPLVHEVRTEYDRISRERQKDEIPGLKQELEDLTAKIAGWTQSLANPKLPASVRRVVESQVDDAVGRQTLLEQEISEAEGRAHMVAQVLDPKDVIECLRRLDQVMAGGNATLTNLELSRHIDTIEVFPDGKVLMRTCRIGAFEGAINLLAGGSESRKKGTKVAVGPAHRVQPRLRRKLSVDPGTDPLSSKAHDINAAADPERFEGLDFNWFWEDIFEMPTATCWSVEHAAEVAAVRSAEDWSHRRLAKHFGKSIPTIRHALKISSQRAAADEESSSSSASDSYPDGEPSWSSDVSGAAV